MARFSPGVSAIESLKKGEADVVQSTLSQGFTSLNKGQAPGCVHFAQVNGTDGFSLLPVQLMTALTGTSWKGQMCWCIMAASR